MESASRKKRKSVDSETSDNETASILKTRRTRAPGRYDRRLDRKFRSCIPFPSLRERESRLERRIRFFHNLQRAITKSVYRSEWSRSALLLAALFRKQHQKAITFRGHREPDDIAKRFPFEELLIRTLCHLDDGNSLLIPYIEALKESKVMTLSINRFESLLLGTRTIGFQAVSFSYDWADATSDGESNRRLKQDAL